MRQHLSVQKIFLVETNLETLNRNCFWIKVEEKTKSEILSIEIEMELGTLGAYKQYLKLLL